MTSSQYGKASPVVVGAAEVMTEVGITVTEDEDIMMELDEDGMTELDEA